MCPVTPRHGASKAKAEFKSGANDVSKWPEGLGIAATFSPEVCRQFGETIAKEYRALGITTALSPQIDLATEPRWMRFEDTFGTHPDQVTDLARLYCDGLQTTPGTADGWGRESVCAMAKHWPGGGPARQKTPLPGKTRRGSFQFRLKPDGYSPAFSVRKSSANWACMAAPRCSTSSGTLYFSWWLV